MITPEDKYYNDYTNIKYTDKILTLPGIQKYSEREWDNYNYNGTHVPRVTDIIEQCTDQTGLIEWCKNVGFKARRIGDAAANIGTIVHESIDQYLIHKYVARDNMDFIPDLEDILPDYRDRVFRSFNNFKKWDKHLASIGCHIDEVIGIEVRILTPWFGGTCDAILRINGAVYLVDFKTSGKISPSYVIQCAAYTWAINNGYVAGLPHIEGIGVIRCDKSKEVINDYFLNDFDPMQHKIIMNAIECFRSYVEAYYRTASTDTLFYAYEKGYSPKNIQWSWNE